MKWDKKGNNNKKFSKGKNFNSFSKHQKFQDFEPREANIGELKIENVDSNYILMGTIEKIQQTGGPTVFMFSDGTGTLGLKGFIKFLRLLATFSSKRQL